MRQVFVILVDPMKGQRHHRKICSSFSRARATEARLPIGESHQRSPNPRCKRDALVFPYRSAGASSATRRKYARACS